MAVFPDRIILKTSTDTLAEIEAAIGPGGSDEILPGELVLANSPGNVRLLARDSADNIVMFGGVDATSLASMSDVQLSTLSDNQFLRYDSASGFWSNVSVTSSDLDDTSLVEVISNPNGSPPQVVSTLSSDSWDGITLRTDSFLAASDYSTILQDNNSYLELEGDFGGVFFQSDSGGLLIRAGLSSEPGELRLQNPNSSTSTSIVAGLATTDLSFALPIDAGTPGFVLTTDGSGTLSWSSGPAPDLSVSSLGSMGDVDLTGLATGDVISWDGSNWTPVTAVTEFGDLSDGERSNDLVALRAGKFALRSDPIATYPAAVTEVGTSYSQTSFYWGETANKRSMIGAGIGGTGAYLEDNGGDNNFWNVFTNDSNHPGGVRLGYRSSGSTWANDFSDSFSSYVELQASPGSNNYKLILPPDEGLAAQVLGTDGSGNLGWYDTYPLVGNGLINVTVTRSGDDLIFTGTGLDGTPISDYPVFAGLQYRFDNQTGESLTIRYPTGEVAYNVNVSNNGTTGLLLGFTPHPEAPPVLTIGNANQAARVNLRVYASEASLGTTPIDRLSDVDTTTRAPLENQALVWDGSSWVPRPVASEFGAVYLEKDSWNRFQDNDSLVAQPGDWAGTGPAAGANRLYLFPASATGNKTSVFESLISNGTPLWVIIESGSSSTPILPVVSLTRDTNDNYVIEWLDSLGGWPVDLGTSGLNTSINVTLIERKVIEVPVLSVNGEIGDVSLGLNELDNYYQDSSLTDGFAWQKGSSGNNGEFEISVYSENGTTFYDLLLANLDSGGVNRRPMMLEFTGLYLRQLSESEFSEIDGTIDSTAVDIIKFKKIDSSTAAQLNSLTVSTPVFFKFEENPVNGYLLKPGSVIQYDQRDQLWKPADIVLESGVESVNGQTGTVSLSLDNLSDVNTSVPAPTDGQALVWSTASQTWQVGSFELIDDTSPQLGGSLDVNNFYLTSSSSGNVEIAPDGVGDFVVRGNSTDGSITLNCTSNTHGVKIQAPPHTDAATYTLILPSNGGAIGQVLTSQGGSQLTWEDGGGTASVIVSANEPTQREDGSALEDGDMWWESGTAALYIYYSSEWVQTAGGGGGNGTTKQRSTQSLTSNSTGLLTFNGLGFAGTLVSITSSSDAWVVLYDSAASRTSDASRAFDSDPDPGSGVLVEMYIAAGETVVASPAIAYFNGDTQLTEAIYANVRDQAGAGVASDIEIVAYADSVVTSVSGGTFGSG